MRLDATEHDIEVHLALVPLPLEVSVGPFRFLEVQNLVPLAGLGTPGENLELDREARVTPPDDLAPEVDVGRDVSRTFRVGWRLPLPQNPLRLQRRRV